jgi:hypothetical protein
MTEEERRQKALKPGHPFSSAVQVVLPDFDALATERAVY